MSYEYVEEKKWTNRWSILSRDGKKFSFMDMGAGTSPSGADDDVIDGDVDEFDEKSDETHDGETDRRRHRDLREFLPVGLRTSLHQSGRVLGELHARLQLHHEDIHGRVR